MSGKIEKWVVNPRKKTVWVTRKFKEIIYLDPDWKLVEKPENKVLATIAIAQLTNKTGWISYDS